MAEGARHARPEYDTTERVGELLRVTKHFDFPSDEDLIPAIGTILSGDDTLTYSLIDARTIPDPKSVQGRRLLLALVYEETEYV